MYFKQGYWTIADWRGTAVSIHISLLGWPMLELMFGASPFEALLGFPGFILLMTTHELGHALMARWRGSQPHAIRLYLFHGQCVYERPHSEFDDVLIAWGGVLAQMVLLAAALATQILFNRFAPHLGRTLHPVFLMLIAVNAYLVFLNLMPFKGLDGRKAWLIIFIALDRMRSRGRQGYANWSRRHRQRKVMRTSKAMTDDLIERIKNK